MGWLGIDIGGANLKAADAQGQCRTLAFPLWHKSDELTAALEELLAEFPTAQNLAVTMTGELADCFATKAVGVLAILEATQRAAGGRPAVVYGTHGEWLSLDQARAAPYAVAAANWRALAQWALRWCGAAPGLVMDVGSTTCDVVPLAGGAVVARGHTDPERLSAGELLYTGVRRSPVCGVVHSTRWRGQACPVAHELFATTWDAYLTLGDLPEQPDRRDTADGRPATRDAARARLARMVCADLTEFDEADALALAQAVAETQRARLSIAVRQVLSRLGQPPATLVLAGPGEFLAQAVLRQLRLSPRVVSLSQSLGGELSACGPAYALAVLAEESHRGSA